MGNGRNDQLGIADGGERDETDAIGEVVKEIGRYVQGQAGFADAARAREGEQAHLWTPQQVTGSSSLLLAPDQWGELGGQVIEPNVHSVQHLSWFGCVSRRKNNYVVLHS